MKGQPDEKRYKAYLKAELEAAAMYRSLAEVDKGTFKEEIFLELVEAELKHAARWAEKLGLDVSRIEPAKSVFKVSMYRTAARIFGTSRIIPWLVRSEMKDIGIYAADPEARDLVADERSHARILRQAAAGEDPIKFLRGESWHRFSNGGSLRAAVLGINDGLVSNFSLVMGVAGGTDRPEFVLLAGVAGLMAGAFSMAAGEYISMRSQKDIYEHQLMIEEAEIREFPEEEEEELVLIYRTKGLSEEDSRNIAKQIMSNPGAALDTMAREELGLDPNQLGSPWGAAFSSFTAFVVGAIVPILPYIFDAGDLTFILSAVLSALALIVVGGALAGLTNRSLLWGSLRMLMAGGAAAAVTFGIGHLIGVTIIG